MLRRLLSPKELLRYAGLFTWLSVAVPLLARVRLFRDGRVNWPAVTMWILYLGYAGAFLLLTRAAARRDPALRTHSLLLVLTAGAMAVSHYTLSGLGAILLMVCGGVLPWLLPLRSASLWLVGQNVAMQPLIARIPNYSELEAILQCGLFLGCSSFIFMISLTARQQAAAREALRKVNAELRATQSLLAESERVAERLRISRELHDLVGHHLTALSLNLEVASHLTEGKARVHVQKAQALGKLLLADVREVVSSLRDSDTIQLSHALHELLDGVPSLQVHLSVPEPFEVSDPARAQVILRLAQEVLTNALKHSQAQNLWLEFAVDREEITMQVRDDGRGVASIAAGNGLSGMRERLSQFGGQLSINSAPGAGFKLAARLPLETLG
jgi:signal transduction histidine kinase